MTTTISRKPQLITPTSIDPDAWLANYEELEPETGVLWSPNKLRPRTTVFRLEGLAVAISTLPQIDDWGTCEWIDGPSRWGQTMRCPGGWIVEVHDGTTTDFAQRVFRGAAGGYAGKSYSDVLECEVWTSLGAADVLWTWLHGSLPAGCSRTLDYLSDEQRRQYGFA